MTKRGSHDLRPLQQGSLGLLARLSDGKVQASIHRIAELQKALAKIESQRDQVTHLKDDYLKRLSDLTVDKGLAQAQELRKFIQNLIAMEEKIVLDQKAAEERIAMAQTGLQDAQLEKRKMESLVERQEVKAAKARSIVEQRALDAAGVSRFNRRQVNG
jgi:flagellar export protein FliJ